jgi:putative peptide zinc metalloprotease protein
MTTGQPPRRAKLELLVRGPDEESFEVKEVSSGSAFAQSRPQRLPPESWELVEIRSRVSREQSFVLKNTTTDAFLLLSESERFLWERMDGRTSLQEIATAYVLRYGEFDFEIIPTLIRKLQLAGLLTFHPTSRLRRALARSRRKRLARAVERTLFGLERINVSSRGVEPFFRALYRGGGFLLFTPLAGVACGVLAIAGLAAGVGLWRSAQSVMAGFGSHPVVGVIAVKILLLLTVAMHQSVHALACVHYGRRVREFGFTFLHGFVPTFFVDTTDIFMASRRARVVTAVSGALVHLVLGSAWFLLAAGSSPGFAQAFAAASGLVQWQAFVLALYPFCFIEMDGYHVLVDVLGVPNLKQDALSYFTSWVRYGPGWPGTREERLWLGYVGLSLASLSAFVLFNVWVIVRAV